MFITLLVELEDWLKENPEANKFREQLRISYFDDDVLTLPTDMSFPVNCTINGRGNNLLFRRAAHVDLIAIFHEICRPGSWYAGFILIGPDGNGKVFSIAVLFYCALWLLELCFTASD